MLALFAHPLARIVIFEELLLGALSDGVRFLVWEVDAEFFQVIYYSRLTRGRAKTYILR
jgi:hypothetical protein